MNIKSKNLKGIFTFSLLATMVMMILSVFSTEKINASSRKSTQIDTSKVYMIKNAHSNKYLGPQNIDFAYRTRLEQQEKESWSFKKHFFVLEPSSTAGAYNIIHSHTGYAVDIRQGQVEPGAVVQLYPPHSYQNQEFKFYGFSGGQYEISPVHSAQYLSIDGNSQNTGAYVVQNPLTRFPDVNESERWILEEANVPYRNLRQYIHGKIQYAGITDDQQLFDGAKRYRLSDSDEEIRSEIAATKALIYPKENTRYRLKSKFSGHYLDIKDASTSVEKELILKTLDRDAKNQMFSFTPSTSFGSYKIKNMNSGFVLDIFRELKDNNTKVIQYYDFNLPHQQFELLPMPDATFKIQAKHSGKMLTVKGRNRGENAELVQWENNSTSTDADQRWFLEAVPKYINTRELVVSQMHHNKDMRINRLLELAQASGLSTDKATINAEIDRYITQNSRYTPFRTFTSSTGFVTTYGMLNKRVDEITFMGSHNAMSNNQDRRSSNSWDTYTDNHDIGTENHKLSIGEHLRQGYRVIDLDIGENGNGKTGSYHKYRLQGYSNLNGSNAILPKIKGFLDENPGEIVIIHISEVYNGTLDLTKLANGGALEHYGTSYYGQHMTNMLKDMRDLGMLQHIYNFTGDNNTSNDNLYGELRTPGKEGNEWPLLKEMIKQDKRILLIQRDAGVGKTVRFKNLNSDPNNVLPENLNITEELLDELQVNGDSHKKILNMEIFEDWGAAAGDINASYVNNDGRRLYNAIKAANQQFKDAGINKIVSFTLLDYTDGNRNRTNGRSRILISPIDAANRLNFDNFGYEWVEQHLPLYGYWR